MEEGEELNRTSAEVLGNEDTQELAANLAMYLPVHKDPLDSSTTAQTALERTPVFDRMVRDLGFNPMKDQWPLATRQAEGEMLIIEGGLFQEPERVKEQRRRMRDQPRRKPRRDRRGS